MSTLYTITNNLTHSEFIILNLPGRCCCGLFEVFVLLVHGFSGNISRQVSDVDELCKSLLKMWLLRKIGTNSLGLGFKWSYFLWLLTLYYGVLVEVKVLLLCACCCKRLNYRLDMKLKNVQSYVRWTWKTHLHWLWRRRQGMGRFRIFGIRTVFLTEKNNILIWNEFIVEFPSIETWHEHYEFKTYLLLSDELSFSHCWYGGLCGLVDWDLKKRKCGETETAWKYKIDFLYETEMFSKHLLGPLISGIWVSIMVVIVPVLWTPWHMVFSTE